MIHSPIYQISKFLLEIHTLAQATTQSNLINQAEQLKAGKRKK